MRNKLYVIFGNIKICVSFHLHRPTMLTILSLFYFRAFCTPSNGTLSNWGLTPRLWSYQPFKLLYLIRVHS